MLDAAPRLVACHLLLVSLLLGCSDDSEGSTPTNTSSGGATAAGSGSTAGSSPASGSGADSGDGAVAVAGGGQETATTGGGPAAGGGELGGEPVDPIPASTKDFDLSALSEDQALTHLSGRYDVAIYFTPEDERDELGKGTLEVAFDGDVVQLTLEGGRGDVLVQVASSLTTPDNASVQLDQAARQLVVDQSTSLLGGIHVSFLDAGALSGYVGSAGAAESYRFRNDVVHYGAGMPPHLAAQVGSWSAVSTSMLCEQAPVLVAVDARGGVRMSGKASADCEDAQVDNAWDGQDDYVAPKLAASDGVEIVIDSFKGGGSQLPGGIFITVPADARQAGVWLAKTVLDGDRGNLEVAFPIKQ
jgi:hypothetical protein